MLSMESCQTSLQVLEKLCAEYGKFSDIATGTGKTVCIEYDIAKVVSMKSCHIATGTGKAVC